MGSLADDMRWVRGANYVPSYAINTLAAWREFDPVQIDRELGYAERLELNSVRVFLHYHVYEHNPARFLEDLEAFVGLCDRHGIRPMLIFFDGCFSIAPSMTTQIWWVAGPGGPRTNPSFYPQGEKFCRDVVGLFRGDPRILIWDAMNEPEAVTFYVGDDTAYAFARHFAEYLKEIDDTHPVTVGMAHAENNRHVADVVDVISFHPYAPTREDLLVRLGRAREVAAGKPIVASETGMPFWGCPYELVLPFFREEQVPAYFFELMIGRNLCASTGGIFYPDGTVRRLSHVEAVLGRPAEGFVKKPDREGVPFAQMKGASYYCGREIERLTAFPINDENAWEYFTLLWSAANPFSIAEDESKYLGEQINDLRGLMEQGRKSEAYPRIEALMREAKRFHWSDRPFFHPDDTTMYDPEGSA
jgi:hypothetical protein